MNSPVKVGDLQRARSETGGVSLQETQHRPVVETASTVLAAQAKALIESRYIMAMNRPRDLDVVRQKLLQECKRPAFAEVAKYRKPIGEGIVGPSIRFAEAAIRCMTNVVVETITIYDDDEKRLVRVSVTDLESNVPYSQDVTIRKAVERRRVKETDVVISKRLNSTNNMVYLIQATDDEILNQQNALISKAIRTLGLRLVPGDLIDEAMDMVDHTQRTKDATDPDAAKRKVFDSFASVGVKVDQLKEYLGHSGETLSPKEMSDLRGLFAAIRDGETTWREIMDARQPPTPKEPQNAPQTGKTPPPAATAPAAPREPVEGAVSFSEIVSHIAKAGSAQDVQQNIIPMIAEIADATEREKLTNMANNRIEVLGQAGHSARTAGTQAETTPQPKAGAPRSNRRELD